VSQEKLRAALEALIEDAERYQRYHDEKFYPGAGIAPTGMRPAIAAARRALSESVDHMKPNDGGFAFPRPLPKGEWPPQQVLNIIERHAGMLLRDYFAASALSAMDIQNSVATPAAGTMARSAYTIADAMMKERAA
jgi:hypothetical protein